MNNELTSPEAALAPTPTLREIIGGFLGLGLISFGGALPLARRALVEQRRWLTSDELIDLLGLCQFLPDRDSVGDHRVHGRDGDEDAESSVVAAGRRKPDRVDRVQARVSRRASPRHLVKPIDQEDYPRLGCLSHFVLSY
ncbi:hypothetical protein HDG40_000844 [Paraburkholderia sp. JPY158]|uniref:Chromate transporter n=1 Tax=Paraburkholderia atlantica TaxID=2654982 RepID=A0A7W8Q2Q0_PARAM|nr:hypothetical protein [Paraburkholderia atlantica]